MDPIADMIIRIKNASNTGKKTVSFPYSNMKMSVADVLHKEGFIGPVAKKGKKEGGKVIEVELLYTDKAPRVRGTQRLSKNSRRMYLGSRDIRPVKRGFGRLILSTPKGILTGKEARKEGIGGEALFSIW